MTPHGHIYYEDSGKVEDITEDMLSVQTLPGFPSHLDIRGIEVIIRVKDKIKRGSPTGEPLF